MMWHDWPASGTKLWTAKIRAERDFVLSHESVVAKLSERHRYIVAAYYGLPPFTEPHTMQDIADRLGVTRDRIRQIKNLALKQLEEEEAIDAGVEALAKRMGRNGGSGAEVSHRECDDHSG